MVIVSIRTFFQFWPSRRMCVGPAWGLNEAVISGTVHYQFSNKKFWSAIIAEITPHSHFHFTHLQREGLDIPLTLSWGSGQCAEQQEPVNCAHGVEERWQSDQKATGERARSDKPPRTCTSPKAASRLPGVSLKETPDQLAVLSCRCEISTRGSGVVIYHLVAFRI